MTIINARDEEFRLLQYVAAIVLDTPNASPLTIQFATYWLLCAEEVRPRLLHSALAFFYAGWEQNSWDALLLAARAGELESVINGDPR